MKQLTVFVNLILCIRKLFCTKQSAANYYSFKPETNVSFSHFISAETSFPTNATAVNPNLAPFEANTSINNNVSLANSASFAFMQPISLTKKRFMKTTSHQMVVEKITTRILLLLIMFGFAWDAGAQNASQYSFSTVATASLALDKNANVVDMSSGTTSLVAAANDDVVSASTNIGFSFTFMGTAYTAFTASSNGGIRLGGAIGNTIIGTSFPVTTQAILAPYLGDLRTSTTGKVHYKLYGTAPNRTAVIEFLNMGINFNNSTANGTFQVRLYEQTNVIEYVYGAMAVGSISTTGSNAANARTVIIGFSSTSGNNNEFTVNQNSPYATSTTATEILNTNSATGNIAGLNSTTNGSRRSFTFTPTLPYHAQFLSMDLGSSSWCAGETRDVTVTIKNIGTATWTNTAPDVNIGMKWNLNGSNWTDYYIRTDANGLAPGATATYTLSITASNNIGAGYTTPLAAGTNNIIFDIVKEGDCWFGDNGGSCGPGNLRYTSLNQTIVAAPTALAGTAVFTCSNSAAVNITAGSAATNAATTTWTSSGTGTFANAGSLTTATYTPSPADITAGSVTLTLTATPNSPCAGNATSNKTLTINQAPGAVAGTPVTTCSSSGAVNITAGSGATNNASITWTSNGTGSYSNATSLTLATYTPSPADVTAGTRSLILTAVGNAGCANTTSNKTITITAAPTAVAGTTISSCSTTTGPVNITAGSSSLNNSGITWTSNGSGTLANANSLTLATYEASPADILAGSVTLTLTATPNSPCAANAVSNKAFTIVPPPTATAGGSQTICQNGTATVSGATSSNGTIAWTDNGAGSVTSGSTTLTPTYTAAAGDAGNTVLLTMTVSNSSCTAATATYTVQVNASATANAGTAISTCGNSGAVNITAGSGTSNSTGITWTSNGTGTFTDANSLTLATYTPSVADIAAGSRTLILTATGNTGCTNATSNKTITINPVPTTTGVTICQGTASASLSSSYTCVSTAPITTANEFAGAGATSGSGTAWSNPGRVTASDNSYASLTLNGSGALSQVLSATDLGFSIPATASIKGIVVSISRFRSGGIFGEIQDNSVKLIKAGVVVGNNLGFTSTDWPTSEAIATYGTTTELWGTTWTAAQLNASNFGVAIVAEKVSLSTRVANIDDIRIAVTYTVPGTLNWYTVSSGGTSIASGSSFDPAATVNSGISNTNTAGTTTFYAECSTVAGCRTPTDYVITAAPSAAISGGDQAVCSDGNPSQTLTATASGGTISWYNAATNGIIVTPTQVGVGTSTYYAQAFDGTCNSLARTAVNLTINPLPVAIGNNQTVCSDGTLTQTLTAAASGGTITWYDASIGGNVVPTPEQIAVGTSTYFAEAFDGTCTSLSRTAVVLTINPVPDAPISGGDQTVCEDGSPAQTLTASATGGTISWYDAATNGNVVTPTQVGVGTSTYYAEASDGTCSSLTRTAVVLTINAAPAAPTASNQTVCSDGNPAQTLTATAAGGTISWFDAATNGNMVTPTQTGVGTSTYYAESSNGICVSLTRTAVTLTINPAANAPVSGGNQTVCSDGNPAQTLTATATGETITWYDAATNGNVVAPTQVGPGTATYYAESSDGTCPSLERAAVTLTINPLPETASVAITQPDCTTATGTITVTAPTGEGFMYSIGAGYQGSPIFPGLPAGTYAVTVQNNFGCTSALAASATVDPQPFVPGVPVVTGLVNVCPYIGTNDELLYTASVAGATSYIWTVPANVSIVSGAGTANLTITIGSGFSNAQPNRQIRVRAVSACGTSAITVFGLLIQTPNTPAPISGPTDICELIGTENTATYKINKVIAATSYTWTTPAGLSSIVHPNGPGINDTSIVVTFSPSYVSGPITVAAFNACGSGGSVRSLNIPRKPASTPGVITGPTNACAYILPGGTVATYSITPVTGATSYTWTTPLNTFVTHPNGSGPNDVTITVQYPEGFTNGTITVKATNGCGTSAVRSLSINRLHPATPGIIDVIQEQVCPDRIYSYTLSVVPSQSTSLIWTIPDGGTQISQTATSILVSYPATSVVGAVTVQAVNNCGSSAIRSTPVRLGACAPEERTSLTGKGQDKGSNQPLTLVSPQKMDVKVFPNPSVSDFNLQVITAGKETINVRMLDMQGRELKRLTVMPYQTIHVGADLKAGSYMMETRQGKEVSTIKLIKF